MKYTRRGEKVGRRGRGGSLLRNETWKLTIAREKRDDVVVLAVEGRLGRDSSGQLIDAVVDVLRPGPARIVIDLAGVDYLSSAGLLTLDAVAGRVHAAGGVLVLCALREPVRLAFALSGLLGELTIEASREEALARIRE